MLERPAHVHTLVSLLARGTPRGVGEQAANILSRWRAGGPSDIADRPL